jgi:hypothetical protein
MLMERVISLAYTESPNEFRQISLLHAPIVKMLTAHVVYIADSKSFSQKGINLYKMQTKKGSSKKAIV